jgi:Immunity protein 52
MIMSKRFFLGAYWGARKENVEQCATRLDRFLNGLKEIDPTLAQWYERGRSRKDAMARPVSALPTSELQTLLLKGRNRYDEGGGFIDELGFSLGMWNGATSEDKESSLRVGCGCFDPLGNNVILDLPIQSENLGDANVACNLLALVAEIWQPKWAGIMSKRAMVERDFDADYPFVDWMVYVPHEVQAAPSSSVVSVGEHGSIVIVQQDRPNGIDPEELQRIRHVEAAILAL